MQLLYKVFFYATLVCVNFPLIKSALYTRLFCLISKYEGPAGSKSIKKEIGLSKILPTSKFFGVK
jgi:hypothetical protein